MSLPPKAKTSPSTANQTVCATAFPTSTCGPHWPWQWFKPLASTTKASQNARYATLVKGQAMPGHPSNAQFQAMGRSNTIKNCPIKPKHIANANSIFRPIIAGVRGITTRCKPSQVEAAPGRIPNDFHHLQKFVVLTANVAFLSTLFQKLRLATVEQLPTGTACQQESSLTKIVRLYAHTGFIKVVMMDQKFNKIKDEINMVKMNTTAARKHVGKIERFIQTIKEHSWALVSDLSYSALPQQVAIHLVYFAMLWLNSLPVAVGVSEIYSLHEIFLSRKLNFTRHCIASFGSYIKAHNDPTIMNTMRLRNFPGIFLGPMGNHQGTHKVFDINTGMVKKPRTVNLLPMPDKVIKVVNNWG